MSDTTDILDRLRSLRRARALRQDFAAGVIGVDRTTYVRKEQGRIPITTEEWVRLASAMGVSPAYFFGDGKAVAEPERPVPGEIPLVRLFRALKNEEREEIASSLSLLLKGIRRRDVTEALGHLRSTPFRVRRD